MRGWQRRDQRPRHASCHLWNKRRLASRPPDTWRLESARVSANSFVVTRCNEQVSNWSWLRRQERADALVVIGNFSLLLWAFVCFCVSVCLQHGRVYIREHFKNCDNERREHHFSCYRGWLSCQVLAAGPRCEHIDNLRAGISNIFMYRDCEKSEIYKETKLTAHAETSHENFCVPWK